MIITPPNIIRNKIEYKEEHWVAKEPLTDEERVLLFDYNQDYADAAEVFEHRFPYSVLDNGEPKVILYRGNIYHTDYDPYQGDMYAYCEEQPLKYAHISEYNHNVAYVSHGRYEHIFGSHDIDATCKDYVEGFISDRLHDYARYFMKLHNLKSKEVYNVYAVYPDKIYHADHYSEHLSNVMSLFYKDSYYWLIITEQSGDITLLEKFETFTSFKTYLVENTELL